MRILVVSHPPLKSELGAAQIAINLGEALRRRGHDVEIWSPEPLPERARWFDRWLWQRRRLEELVRRAGPFDVVDAPAISIGRRLAREVAVVARSVQPDLRYAWVELREGLGLRASAPRTWLRAGAYAAHLAIVCCAVVRGWHRARLILALGSSEAAWIRKRLPWLSSRLRHYVSAPSVEDRARLAQVRQNRQPPPGPGLRFLWIGRWAGHKGTARLVRFAVERARSHPEDRFTVAGCGPAAEGDLPPELLAGGCVRVVQSFSREDLPALLEAHDVGLFTSRVEGWGLSLNEMLESGLPVYATTAGAVEDLSLLVGGALQPFPPPDELGPRSLPPPVSLDGYLETTSWASIAERYEEDVRDALGDSLPRGLSSGDREQRSSVDRRPRTRSFPLHRLRANVWRFSTRRFSEATLGGLPDGVLVKRRLFGHTAWLEISRSSTHRLLYLEGERVVKERPLLHRLIRRGDVVVDVGANVGYYMLMVAQLVGPRGRVICFEPEPSNFQELERNRELNRLARVELHREAVGDRIGEISFKSGLNGVISDDGNGDLDIPITCLDAALDVVPDLVKIDVEGYEGQVLQGASELVETHRPNLFVEIHPGMLHAPSTVASILDWLRRRYSTVEAYGPRPEAGIAEKVKQRYLGGSAIERLVDADAVLEAVEREGGSTRAFWLVCRNGRKGTVGS